jgi:hypothetical protein
LTKKEYWELEKFLGMALGGAVDTADLMYDTERQANHRFFDQWDKFEALSLQRPELWQKEVRLKTQ